MYTFETMLVNIVEVQYKVQYKVQLTVLIKPCIIIITILVKQARP